jgi:hypothetical protein
MHPNEEFLTKFKTKEDGQELVRTITEHTLGHMTRAHMEAWAEQLKRLNILPDIQPEQNSSKS